MGGGLGPADTLRTITLLSQVFLVRWSVLSSSFMRSAVWSHRRYRAGHLRRCRCQQLLGDDAPYSISRLGVAPFWRRSDYRVGMASSVPGSALSVAHTGQTHRSCWNQCGGIGPPRASSTSALLGRPYHCPITFHLAPWSPLSKFTAGWPQLRIVWWPYHHAARSQAELLPS